MLDGGAVGLDGNVGQREERLVLAGEREAAPEHGVEQALVADLVDREDDAVRAVAERQRERATERGDGLVPQAREPLGQGGAATLDVPVRRHRAGLVHLERPVGGLAQVDAPRGTPHPLILTPVRDRVPHGPHLCQGALADDTEDRAHRAPFPSPDRSTPAG